MQTQTNNWINSKTAEVNNTFKTYTDSLSALQTKFNNEYNSQVAKFNSKYSSVNTEWDNLKNTINSAAKSERDDINSQWTNQKASIDSDYKAKLSDALSQVTSEKNSLISKINSEWKTQSDKIQSDFTAFLADFTKRVSSASTELGNIEKELPDLKKLLQELKDNVSNFNPSEFIKKDDFSKIALKISGISNGTETEPTQTIGLKVTNDGYSLDLDGNSPLIQYLNAIVQWYVNQRPQEQSQLENSLSQSLEYLQNTLNQNISDISNTIQKDYATKTDVTNSINNHHDVSIIENNAINASSLTNSGIYVCRNSGNTGTPTFFNDKRGTLVVYNFDTNAKTQLWFPVGNEGRSFDFAIRYWEGNTAPAWKKIINSDDVQNLINAHKPDLSGINNSINDLKNKNNELQSQINTLKNKEYIHVATNETDAANYAKAHPDVVVILKGS